MPQVNQEKRLVLNWTRLQDVLPLEHHLAAQVSKYTQVQKNIYSFYQDITKTYGTETPEYEHIDDIVATIAATSNTVVVIAESYTKFALDTFVKLYTPLFPPTNSNHKYPYILTLGDTLSTQELVDALEFIKDTTPTLIIVEPQEKRSTWENLLKVVLSFFEERFFTDELKERIYVFTQKQETSCIKEIEDDHYVVIYEHPLHFYNSVVEFITKLIGINPQELLSAFRAATNDAVEANNASLETNPALCYGILRNLLPEHGIAEEVFISWNPKFQAALRYLQEKLAVLHKALQQDHARAQDSSQEQLPLMLNTRNQALYPRDTFLLQQYSRNQTKTHAPFLFTHFAVKSEHAYLRRALKTHILVSSPQNINLSSSLHETYTQASTFEWHDYQTHALETLLLEQVDAYIPSLIWEIPDYTPWWIAYTLQTLWLGGLFAYFARTSAMPLTLPYNEWTNKALNMLLQAERVEVLQQLAQRIERGQRLRALGRTVKAHHTH